MTEESPESPLGGSTRRGLLAGVGVVGVAGVVAACGGSSGSSGPSSSSGAGDTSSSGTGGSGAYGGGQTGSLAPAPAGALAKTSDIPVGGGKIFESEMVVVTQPTAGQFKAFSAVCTHKGCTVGSVSGGTINCPCHGSKYKISDASVVAGPAPQPLPARQVKVAGGEITLA